MVVCSRYAWFLLLMMMMMVVLKSSLVLSYPTGAPDCTITMPQHSGNVPQTSPSPFQVSTSKSSVTAGDPLTVQIKSTTSEPFKGFTVRAVLIDHSDIIGQFQVDTTKYHTLDCPHQPSGAVTHSNNTLKTNAEFIWTSPTSFSGTVTFVATVVREFAIFWVDVQSAPVTVRGSFPYSSSVGTSSTPGTTTRPSDDLYSGCGEIKSCFGFPQNCIASESCDAITTFVKNEDVIDFQLMGVSEGYVAVGFSTDAAMGDDSVRECVNNAGNINAYESYNVKLAGGKNGNERIGQISLSGASLSDGKIICSFKLNPAFVAKSVNYDLIENNYYVLLALGSLGSNDSLTYHTKRAYSTSPLNFTAIEIGASSSIELAVVIHGTDNRSLMVVSWVGTVSVAIFLARYYKQMWPETTHCKVKVWFAWHRFLNMVTVVLTSAAFILIFVHANGWSSEWPANPHPLLGVITTALMWIQPIMALFRCHPGTPRRPIFNWLHFLVGMSAVILSIVTLFYTVKLRSVDLPQYFWWILIAYVAFFVIMFAVMEFFACLSAQKTVKEGISMQDFSGSGNGGFSAANGDISSALTYQAIRFKQVMLILFVTGVGGFAVALVVVICTF